MGFNRFDNPIEDRVGQHVRLQLPEKPGKGAVKEPKNTRPSNQIPKQSLTNPRPTKPLPKKTRPAQPSEIEMTGDKKRTLFKKNPVVKSKTKDVRGRSRV